MLMLLRIEFFKLRRRGILLFGIGMLIIEVSWAFTAISMSMARNPQVDVWASLILLVASMNSLLLPLLAAIMASRICDMEHKGNTWKLLLSAAIRPGQLYAAKYLCLCSIMLGICILQSSAILLYGWLISSHEPVPGLLLLRFFCGTILTTATVLALQQWVSIVVHNQAWALCLGMLGACLGMTAELFPASVRILWIWSYYTVLSPVTSSYADEHLQFIIRHVLDTLPGIIGLLLGAALLYTAGHMHLSRQYK
ncbi:ABC-2 family transporter protein [compost metagenome]